MQSEKVGLEASGFDDVQERIQSLNNEIVAKLQYVNEKFGFGIGWDGWLINVSQLAEVEAEELRSPTTRSLYYIPDQQGTALQNIRNQYHSAVEFDLPGEDLGFCGSEADIDRLMQKCSNQSTYQGQNCLGITTKNVQGKEVGWCMKNKNRSNYQLKSGNLGEKIYVRRDVLENLSEDGSTIPGINNFVPCVSGTDRSLCPPIVAGVTNYARGGKETPSLSPTPSNPTAQDISNMSNNYLPMRSGDLYSGDIGQCGRSGATLYDLQKECFENPDCMAVTTTREGAPWCKKKSKSTERKFHN